MLRPVPSSSCIRKKKSFRMHEDLGTGPNIHYLWETES